MVRVAGWVGPETSSMMGSSAAYWCEREGCHRSRIPVVLKQVKEISCLPVNTRACSSTRHYTTHSYPQQCGGVSAVRDGVALQRRSSRTGETDLPFLSSAVRLPRGPLPTLPGQGVSQG